jgi:hypothetical protein
MALSDWRLVPATDIDVSHWSYGAAKDVPSLYSSRTFGPKNNFRCACGKYAGEAYDNIICDRCGVKICADADAVRSERIGHILLARPCYHPITRGLLESFPVAPIAVRTDPDGTPNALGRKYEQLVAVNLAAAEALPSRDDAHAYYPAARDFDPTDLLAAMSAILTGTADHAEGDSILGLINAALATGSAHLTALIRAYGYAMKVDVTL